MAIIATNNGGSTREPLEAGMYVARCFQMIHIGTVKEDFQGEEKVLNKCRIVFELPTEKRQFKEGEEEKPYTIGKDFTLSMHEKSGLRKFLSSWRGKSFSEEEAKSFDITRLLGVACMLSIIHKPSKDGTRVYEEISAIAMPMKNYPIPDQINPSQELSYGSFDWDLYNSLPDFIKEKIKLSAEFKSLTEGKAEVAAGAVAGGDDDNLPF